MKLIFTILTFSILGFVAIAQEWSEPILIVEDDYLKGGFDMFIDSEGVIHGAWHGQNEEDHSQDKIFYSKSLDGGQTWETPTIIDQNRTKYPKIVVDTEGNIYILYGYLVSYGTTALAVMKMFDGSSWSPRDTISLNMPGSYYYNLEINDDNEIIAIWDWGQPYYRIYKSGAWGDIKSAYNDNNGRVFRNTSIDNNFVIHAATSFYYSGENITYERIGISKYKSTTDVWDSTIIISERRVMNGYGITCDINSKTHLAYSQYVDTLLRHFNYYAFDNGNGFQYHQFLSDEMGTDHNIIIDQNGSVHICYILFPEFDKDENKHFTKLVHYTNMYGVWDSTIIDFDYEKNLGVTCLQKFNNKIYLGYQKLRESLFPRSADIYFTSLEIPVGISVDNSKTDFLLEVFPNPVEKSFKLITGLSGYGKVKIINSKGQIIEQQTKMFKGNQFVQINLNREVKSYPKGIYLICIEMNGVVLFKKIIIE